MDLVQYRNWCWPDSGDDFHAWLRAHPTIPYFDHEKFRLMKVQEYSRYYEELKMSKAPIFTSGLLGSRRPKEVNVTLLVMECQLLDRYALVRSMNKLGEEETIAIEPTAEYKAAPFNININRYFERFFVEDGCAIQENQRGSEKTIRGSFGKPFNCLYSITAHGVITCQLSKESIQCMLTAMLALETLIQRVEQVHRPTATPFTVRHARIATMQATCDFGVKADVHALKFWNPWSTKEYTKNTTAGFESTDTDTGATSSNSPAKQGNSGSGSSSSRKKSGLESKMNIQFNNIVYYTASSASFRQMCIPKPPFFAMTNETRYEAEKDFLVGNLTPVSPEAGYVSREDKLPCRPTTISTVFMAQHGKSTVSCINCTSWIECLAGFTELYEQILFCEYAGRLIEPALSECRSMIVNCKESLNKFMYQKDLADIVCEHFKKTFCPVWSSIVVFPSDKITPEFAREIQDIVSSTLVNSFYNCRNHTTKEHYSADLFKGLEIELNERIEAELRIQEELKMRLNSDKFYDVKRAKGGAKGAAANNSTASAAAAASRATNLRARGQTTAKNGAVAKQGAKRRVVYLNSTPLPLTSTPSHHHFEDEYASSDVAPKASQSCPKCIMGLLLLHLPYIRQDEIHFMDKIRGVTDNMWLYLQTK